MPDKEWERFFELMRKIVELEMPVSDKIETVADKAVEFDAEMALDEFNSWVFDL